MILSVALGIVLGVILLVYVLPIAIALFIAGLDRYPVLTLLVSGVIVYLLICVLCS